MPTVRRLRIPRSARTGPGLPVVTRPLTARGWQVATHDDGWDLWWGNHVPPDEVYGLLDPTRWVNHIPGIGALTRKDRLAQEMASSLERNANRPGAAREPWVPLTYVLPSDRAGLLDHAARDPAARWIAKPRAGARGEGVTLVEDCEAAARLGQGWLVQQYISDPHLIDGHTYTLRVYVAITSVDPLLVHVFDDGFAKLASRPYPKDPADRGRFAHLTNPDVLRADTQAPVSSRNLTLEAYRALLRTQGHDDILLMSRLDSLVATSVASVREALWASLSFRTQHPSQCFELLGFDVALDEDLRPWLIECNLAPSLSIEADRSSPAATEEAAVKSHLVADLFALVGLTGPRPSRASTRTSGWRRVFPPPPAGGPGSDAAWAALTLPRPQELELSPGRPSGALVPASDIATYELGDTLVTLAPRTGSVQVLNGTAAHFWDGLRTGEDLADLVTDVIDVTGAPRALVERDLAHLLARWREVVMMTDADTPTTPRDFVAAPKVLLHASWNAERIYTVADTAVAIHLPSWALEDTVKLGLAETVDTAAAHANHRIEVAPWRGHYDVRVDGERVAPPMPAEALAAWCRDTVLSLAGQQFDRQGQGVLVHGSAFEVDGASVVVLAPPAVRADLLERWATGGSRVVADALVPFTRHGTTPLHVGYAKPASSAKDDPRRTVHVDRDGSPVSFAAIPHPRRSRTSLPVRAIVLAAPAEVGRPTTDPSPWTALLACVAARPHPTSPLHPDSLHAVVQHLSDPHLRSVAVREPINPTQVARDILRVIDGLPKFNPSQP